MRALLIISIIPFYNTLLRCHQKKGSDLECMLLFQKGYCDIFCLKISINSISKVLDVIKKVLETTSKTLDVIKEVLETVSKTLDAVKEVLEITSKTLDATLKVLDFENS